MRGVKVWEREDTITCNMKALSLARQGNWIVCGPGQGAHIQLRTLYTLVRTHTMTKKEASASVTVINFDPSNTTLREKIPCGNIYKGREHTMKLFFKERKICAKQPNSNKEPCLPF